MNKIITCGLFLCIVQKSVAEEPFCGNKCYDKGVVVSRTCQCDIACSTAYNDCCSDSKHYEKGGKNATRGLACKRKALVVNACNKEWKGPDFIVNSCKLSYNYEMDPVGNSPVTSEATGVTYNNYYCAICNGDAERLLMWNIKMSCPLAAGNNANLDKDEAFKSIFYSYSTNEWGYVTANNLTKKSSFQGCAVTSEIPEAHASKIRRCESGEVGRCPDTWKKDAIRDMCSSYSDPVFSAGTKYKNLYCAVCNRVDISTISCGEAQSPRNNEQPTESDDSNKMSFSLLLDINFSEGNSVGRRLAMTNCRQGEIFDPFARRCRNIVCGIPGYVMQNGLCTAERDPPPPAL